MKALIIGNGQLASELVAICPESVELIHATRDRLDITSPVQCRSVLEEVRPDVVINAAAYTAVDQAETDEEQAYAVNESGPRHLARVCQSLGCRFVHVSTDFVFDGNATTPYHPDAAPAPMGVYGASKLAGERAVGGVNPDAVIIRTSWVYSAQGKNFVKTMLRLMRDKPELKVVSDQIGAPTWARSLAQLIWQGARQSVPGGLYHWSDKGRISWYDFAVAIQQEALGLGLLDKAIPIHPIPSTEFPTPARRPAYSVLDTASTQTAFGLVPRDWQAALREMMAEL